MTDEAERYHLGITIAGRYRVESPIGEGAMGTVALARHVSLDEKVAVKFLKPELRRDPIAIARLSREARALARIKSDHVTRVLDVGITLEVGPYMVMEYLEGTDLGEVLEAEGPLPVERVVEIVMQVCEALTVAHTAGLVHRDIKPQNLFLARHGQFETLKILDFGIAEDTQNTLSSKDGSALPPDGDTTANPLYGTPSYMSPERIRNDAAADHRSDIWSLGVVLHELLTGRAVFDAPTATETCERVVSNAPLALESNDALLPPALRSIIARCLERDPSRRYQSVEELAAALAPLGTMTERFRGRSTGAFSRKYIEEQLALSKTQRLQLPAPSANPPTPDELSGVLRDVGTALRWVLQAVPRARLHDRPLWHYGAVALGSALAVTLGTSLANNVHWVSPPEVTVRGEPLEPGERHAVHGVDEPTVTPEWSERAVPSAPLALNVASQNVESQNIASQNVASQPAGAEEPAPAAEAPSQTPLPRATRPSKRATREHRVLARAKPESEAARRRRAAELPLITAKEPDEAAPATPPPAAPEERPRLVPDRTSPVRLVADTLVTNRAQREANARAARAARAPAAQPDGKAPLPEWLELMRNDQAEAEKP